MKWENIKTKCAKAAYSYIMAEYSEYGPLAYALTIHRLEKGKMKSREFKKECANQVFDAIMRWDIRQWKSLQDAFPTTFPKGSFSVELREEWELIQK